MALNKMNIKNAINSLVVFKNLKYNPCLHSLLLVLENDENKFKNYSKFINELVKYDLNFTRLIKDLVFSDENILTQTISKNKDWALLKPQVEFELNNLYEISKICKDDFCEEINENFKLFPVCEESFCDAYFERINNFSKIGFGIFSYNFVFTANDEGELTPVKTFNIRQLNNMYNYEREREKIINNTRALVEGKPSCNVLLYGDAGTGKSSSIKAIANEFFKDGLRLIEIKKSQIEIIPNIIDKISNNPLKFIIFIDDVTFASEDPAFCALKTILDGDSKGISDNVAIYVTSNHRHLVKETKSERDPDLIHATDNIQGILGLTARFGLTVTFLRPDKLVYSDIIIAMAKEKGIECDKDNLLIRAEAFAIRNGGRTPRCAKQFIDLVYSGVEKL